MILGAFCAIVCALAPWHAAVEPGGAIVMNGVQVGMYVDDEEPNQAAVALADESLGEAVVAGISPCNCYRIPGALNALEWYPYHNGRAVGRISPPYARAFIVQGRFHWPQDTWGATPAEQRRLRRDAIAEHPLLVLTFNGVP